LDGSYDTPAATSRQSEEISAADGLQNDSSLVSLRPLTAASQSNNDRVRAVAAGPASSDGLAVHGAVSLYSALSVVRTEPRHKVAEQQAVQSEGVKTPANASVLRNDASRIPQSASDLDGSISTDRRNSPSPEIDILPAVRRARAPSDYGSNNSSDGFDGTKSLQCARSNADGHDVSTVEPHVSQLPVRRCGSPGLDEDGQFSYHKLRHVPAAVSPSQSTVVGGVKLIPLSQVMSTSPSARTASAGTASKHCSAETSHAAEISTEAARGKFPKSREPSRSSPTLGEQAESTKVPKAGRRRSSRLRVPKGILGRAKRPPVDETKAVKFDVSFRRVEPTDKENLCIQRATEQHAVPSQQPPQQDSRKRSRPSPKSHTSSCNASPSGEETDVSSAEVRRSFIKCARLDVENADRQRLPTSWERHTNKSPVAGRRMSDRMKQKEGDGVSTQPNECEKSSPPVTGRKRRASSSSSALSSGEKQSAKKITRTIAMTSLHSKWVLCNSYMH